MHFIPLPKRLDDWFRNNRSILLKTLGAASVGGFAGVLGVIRSEHGGQPIPSHMAAVLIAGFTAAGAFVGLGLSLRDLVVERLANERPVHPLLRFLFAMRGISVAFWIVAFVAGAITVLSLVITK